ncbi:histidine phosphatase family protein [Oscillatoria sp. FACHB-1406]|uniref:histidine phosphatase family protein n=1 Tax=Oscillatoria sp. FACHB-1406 TaxID=2692846 RepID=UPI001689B717|nr:histidine phosphatase family protein [Oscillatoria sp. FACHB-1406]MBD2580091.1 histidine phosphatase family protein [Oscillatoria sp. FACHB-1406]
MPQTVWIARHGNRFDFVNPDWFLTAERPYDPSLSDDGFVQAKELGERLKLERIDRIFASPFLRTVQTAWEVAKVLQLPICLEAGLSEWLNPDWMRAMPEREKLEVLAERYNAIDLSYTSRIVPQYPEDERAMRDRVVKTIQTLAAEFSDNILLVTHGAFVVEGAIALLGYRAEVTAALCCLVKLVRTGEKWEMELNGDTSHLSQSQGKVRFARSE